MGRFPVEPWSLTETSLDIDALARTESLFALSNGHVGLRGNLDEGEPCGSPGTYLNGFYEQRPLPYAEPAYGDPTTGQALVDVTDGKLVRLLVDDWPLDVRYGTVHEHRRRLDLRTGLLERTTQWSSSAGARVRVTSRRLVSLEQRSVVALEYVVEPLDGPRHLVVQSELVAATPQEEAPGAGGRGGDPRASGAAPAALRPLSHEEHGGVAVLVHRTAASGLRMAAAMHHVVQGPGGTEVSTEHDEGWARTTVVSRVEPGQSLRLVKTVTYAWSGERSATALRDQARAAMTGAVSTGWDRLVAAQRAVLDGYWADADVQVEGDPELQQAVRFAQFHVLQAGIRAEGRAIPAKGLTGAGYDGHTFWDTEMFVLPLLTWTCPEAAAHALRWRASTLDDARRRAGELGLDGAAFPWRTISGPECSGYWPAGTAAFHISAAVSAAAERYRAAAEPERGAAFEAATGLALHVAVARMYLSLGHHDPTGGWHLDGVTGPDEYSALGDDNVYTNLMAAAALRAAADAADRCPDVAAALGVGPEDQAAWRTAADAVHLPYDRTLGVHQQSAAFTAHQEWDFEGNRDYPLLLSAAYVDLYRRQVVKQADLVLAMHWCGDRFSAEDKARNVDYYERRTVRDSSLSACTQAVVAAEVGHLDLAAAYAREAALVDLHDVQHNTGDGLHVASLAGAWLALVAGFGGFRDHGGLPSFDPALPPGTDRLRFRLLWRGLRVVVDVGEAATYSLERPSGAPEGEDEGPATLTVLHAGEEVRLTSAAPTTVALRAREPLLPAPPQPPGRAPAGR